MSFLIECRECLMIADTRTKKTCLFCGTMFYGRSDKRYCDDNCRNRYHYQTRKKERNNKSVVKSINDILSFNREILYSLNRKRSAVVKKQRLVEKRFDFELITACYKTKKGVEYRVVYDYAYKFINEDDVLLFRYSKKNNMIHNDN